MSKVIDIINMQGVKVGDYTIDDSCLESVKGEQAVHDAVVAFRAAMRAGTADVKTRGEVSGSGKKPFKQKGGGRARAGSTRNPVWRHGGHSFGPKPRDYSVKLNAKVKKLALKRSFTERIDENSVVVVDKFEFAEPKTKGAVAALKSMNLFGDNKKKPAKILILINDYDVNSILAVSNIANAGMLHVSSVNTFHVLDADKILFTKEALDAFVKRLA